MPAPDPDRVAAGRRLYEGLDPRPAHGIDGSALASYSTACVRCHRPSGLGSAAVEPNVPPITGAFLFEPLDPATGQRFPWPATFRARPAYDIAALQELLASGRAPDGFELREPMPRYVLSTEDVQALAAYLRHLSMASVPPGVEDRTVRFATVTTPEAPADEVRALVATLQRYAAERGSAAHPEHAGARGDAGDDPGAGRAWRVEHWSLSGSPDTWAEQLQARQAAQPVYALLSGLGYDTWSPVRDFCERQRLPCLFPQVLDVPREASRYSLYLDAGLQGQVAQALLDWRADPVGGQVAPFVLLGDATAVTARLMELAVTEVADAGEPVHGGPPAAGPWAALALSAGAEAYARSLALPPARLYLPQCVADAAERGAAGRGPPTFALRAQVTPEERVRRLARARNWLLARRIAARGQAEAVAASALFAATVVMETLTQTVLGYPREFLIEKIEATLDRMPAIAPYDGLALGADQRVASPGVRVQGLVPAPQRP